MKTHMFSHGKERTFQCTFCTKAFKYPDQLNRHKLLHTVGNKFQCEICEKTFVNLTQSLLSAVPEDLKFVV
jgi:uncharacterized Zn-finger protein